MTKTLKLRGLIGVSWTWYVRGSTAEYMIMEILPRLEQDRVIPWGATFEICDLVFLSATDEYNLYCHTPV